MNTAYDFDQLLELIRAKRYKELQQIFSRENKADVAGFLEELPPDLLVVVFRLLQKEIAADVFSNLPPETQQIIVESVTDSELSAIIEDLYLDDAVDLVEELPANVVKRVLKNARPETRRLINQYLKYPDNSVGSIMTAEYVDLTKSMTVREAIAHIRDTGEDSELIYTCYITDDRRVLEGVVTVKDLLLAGDDRRISELMEPDVITAKTLEDQEEAVQKMMHYDFISLPVVDDEKRLVGIVTVDDVMDVMEEEATEDFEKMAAIRPSEKPYLKTSAFSLAANRLPWLLVLMVSSMFTGSILSRFEQAFAALPVLVTFIPMLTGTGGNCGSQSSTLIIRGMAVGEIEIRDLLVVLWKEIRVSLIVGFMLGLVNFGRVMLFYSAGAALAATIALALFATVVIAKTIGGVLPILAKALGGDPALMASSLITTAVDALALIIYFNLAQRILGL